jgi:O-antigen/teichoic acid export membrane protein
MSFRTRLAAFLGSSFFKGSFIYLSGSVLNSALPLLLLPVLTRHLTPTDFGFVATATVLTQMLSVFIGLNAYGLVARSHFDDDPEALRNLLSTGMGISVAVAGCTLLLVVLLGQPIARWTEFPAAWLPAVIFIAFATVVQTNYLSLLQVRSEPLRYIAIQTVGGVLNLGLAVWLVVGFRMDWHGRMWALVAAQGIVALICLRGLIFRLGLLRPRFLRSAYRQLVAFGVPLIPHAIGGWVMTMAARLYLNNMATLADTGLYSVAFNLTSPLALLIGAANNAYTPALFQHLSSREGYDKIRLCRILVVVGLSLPLLAVLCAAAVRWVLPWIVNERFFGAADFVLWMALTYALQGIYFIFGNFVVYSKKTSLMAWRADFAGGVVMLIACPLLIRLNGPLGAAQAACLAFAGSTLGCISAAQKAFPMPWRQALLSFR